MENPLVPVMAPYASTIFSEMSALALRTNSVNLGQGFPDVEGPQFLVDLACEAIRGGQNQYAPRTGLPELRRAIADHQRRFYGLDVDPETEVLVTAGATEGIAAAILALVRPGDEVVTFEPYFDCYPPMVARAGGTLRTVPLRFPDHAVDEQALATAFSDRTRLVVLNTPHNPTGKVFTRDELRLIAELARRHDAWILTDEVYEHLVLDDTPHVPMATLPEAADRTLTMSSAGKTFSMTGWKVGWITGPAEGLAAVTSMKQWLTFTTSGPFQYAIAHGLAMDDAAYAVTADELRARRDQLLTGLADLGIRTNHPEATYFVLADLSPLGLDDALTGTTAFAEEHGVVGIPAASFVTGAEVEATAPLVRFAFCKREEIIAEGLRRLGAVLGRG
ncbi:aminotransferase class I/II-fold pyridoxal phosphate-dependent enzyme [Mobilicoccus pelagius]|uniref:Putative aminotransferase n=1 Tax=Mobilicoccus pelagius NBRC 104925 TaxID=1089455 RepID=H5UN81_9MICO|nr:aminotransferase class I/II-fold pyridoxal phosphate-dependent enzyme [Mobilicoccus pelagius]GAB47189.1 putative aminotransferase [Mobilicoccus pelagius NBRC 104925]